MITVKQLVTDVIKRTPFLEDGLANGLINLSALARRIQPEIQDALLKDVSVASVTMALKRLAAELAHNPLTDPHLATFGGSITVRSHLVEYNFKNSDGFIDAQKELLHAAKRDPEAFLNISQGVFETTLVASRSLKTVIEELTAAEQRLLYLGDLAAVTIRFTEETAFTPGVYYCVLKALAWEHINFIEIVSVAAELTIIFEEQQVERAFRVIKRMTT